LKKIFISLFILSVFSGALFSYVISGTYNYDYLLAYGNNYFSRNNINTSFSSEKEWFNFYAEFDATFYFGDAKYNIPYPAIDSTILGFLPSYISFSNSYIVPQIYLSVYYEGVNIKLGKFFNKLGISEIYSPADIITPSSPFNLYSKQEGVNGLYMAYSIEDINISALYQDGSKYEDTKQGLEFDAINRYFSVNFFSIHYFRTVRDLFSYNQRESFLFGSSVLSDYFGPGLWAEFIYNYSPISSEKYLTIGVDYTFYDMLFVQMEYMRCFDGLEAPYSESSIISRLLNKQFAIGVNYLFSTVKINKGEALEAGLLTAINLDDGSFEGGGSIAYNPFDFASVSLSAVMSYGELLDEFFSIPPTFVFNIKYNFY